MMCPKTATRGGGARMAHSQGSSLAWQSASNEQQRGTRFRRRHRIAIKEWIRCGHVSEPTRGILNGDTFRSYEEQSSGVVGCCDRRAPAITVRPYLQAAASERRRSSCRSALPVLWTQPGRVPSVLTCGDRPPRQGFNICRGDRGA